ncbi:MAG: helix-turn-helix transcriptional regulator [Caulobacter sp.]|nr:helix-turn-helix transcriptional regulator [Caulobacter sp.]
MYDAPFDTPPAHDGLPDAALSRMSRLAGDAEAALAVNDRASAQEAMDRLAVLIGTFMARGAEAETPSPQRPKHRIEVRRCLTSWEIRRLEAFLDANIDKSFDVATLAAQIDLSVGYFGKLFCAHYGRTPKKHLLHLRMERAKRLMVETDETLAAIAYTAGFCDQSHLTRMFSSFMGQTPTAWRRLARQAAGRPARLVRAC